MIKQIWFVWLWALLASAACASAAADAAPAKAVKLGWQYSTGSEVYNIVSDSIVRTLACPLSSPCCIDVDELGRFYVMDFGRGSLMRFDLDGSLGKVWPDNTDIDRAEVRWMSRRISVIDQDRIVLSAIMARSSKGCVLGPSDTEIRTSVDDGARTEAELQEPRDHLVAGCPDGKYFTIDQTGYNPGDDPKWKNRVTLRSADGKAVTTWNASGSVTSAAVGPDGNLYCNQWLDKRIVVYTQDGKEVRKIDPSAAYPTHMDGSYYTASLHVDANGDIYATCIDWIVRMDGQGKLLKRWQPSCTADAPIVVDCMSGMSVRNGMVYAVVMHMDDSRSVQCFTPDGTCVAYYRSPKPDVCLPTRLAVSKDGCAAFVPNGKSLAVYLDPAGKPYPPSPWLDCGYAAGFAAKSPSGYYIATSNGLYAVDTHGKPERTLLSIEKFARTDDRFRVTEHAAVDPRNGDVWSYSEIPDGKSHMELVVFSPEGKLLRRMNAYLQNFCVPGGHNFVVDKQGCVYEAGYYRHAVGKFDADGNRAASIGVKGKGIGELCDPSTVLVDDSGNIIVCDTGNSRLQVFSKDGTPLGVWGRYGHGDGEFDRPLGMDFGPKNTLWIADTFNDRIVKVPLDVLMSNLTREVKTAVAVTVVKKEAAPEPGLVTVTGIVIAGTDDLTDCAYIESADRAWGIRVELPAGASPRRGDKCSVKGRLDLKERSARYLKAESVEKLGADKTDIIPLGAANLYIGDGYWAGKNVGLSNLGMLVRTWGRVTAVVPEKNLFIIDDGSGPGDGTGLPILVDGLKKPFSDWPKIGQYLAVTGVSSTVKTDSGQYVSALRLRGGGEIQVIKDVGK